MSKIDDYVRHPGSAELRARKHVTTRRHQAGHRIIIVGQNIQAKAADTRADETYKDAEAVLKEAAMIQDHLTKQDELIAHDLEQLKPLAPKTG